MERKIMENITSILSGTDVQSIANLLKKEREFDNIYNFICKRFEYIPLKFTKMDIDEINKNPIKANQQFSVDVDGANGDTTIETPESLLEIYISVWDNILKYEKKEIPEDRPGRKPMISGPHYKYNLAGSKDSSIQEAAVSGDVLISFPKFEIREYVSENYIKLFARLVYTIGNFMPVPKLEKNSLNIIHGHCCANQGLVRGGYERMDCFLLDIADNNSRNKESYKRLLGDGYSIENFAKIFYLDSYMNNIGEVLDLSAYKTNKYCKKRDELEKLNKANFQNYIINGCACIIARGNRLLEIKKIKNYKKRLVVLKEKDFQFRGYILKNSKNARLKAFSFDTEKHVYDPDSSLLAWKYYLKVYKDLLCITEADKNSLFHEDYTTNPEEKKFGLEGKAYKRVVGTFKYFDIKSGESLKKYVFDKRGLSKGENIGLAGDCVFNFNEKKVWDFWKCIDSDEQENINCKEIVKELLILAFSLHHAIFNFSLMPVNGGLNKTKGRTKKDGLDDLGYKLKDVYKELKEDRSEKEYDSLVKILGMDRRYKETNEALIDFLKKVESFENYCNIFYNIDAERDKELFQALFSNSAKEIRNTEDLIQYIGLAVQYWEHQVKIFEKRICEKNCKEIRK